MEQSHSKDESSAATPGLTLKNSLAKISFCDRECYNVNNNKTKENILKYITSKFNIQVIDKQYVSLNPHMIRNITSHEHILATFTNGNPYILWLTTIDDVPCSIYIDRKLKEGYSYPKIHVVNYQFSKELFQQNTIFTGELVRDINRNWLFLISDILYYNNQNTKTKNVLARFQLIYDVLENHFMPDTTSDICQIMAKRLFQYSDIKYIFNEFMPSLSYVCKGLVLYTLNNQFSNYAWVIPKEDQIQVKRKHEADDIFFSKYPEYLAHKHIFDNQLPYLSTAAASKLINTDTTIRSADEGARPTASTEEPGTTINLFIVKTDIPDIYNLYTRDDRINRHSIAFIPDLKTSQLLYNFFRSSGNIIDIIATCRYHNYFKRWIPFAVSMDQKDSSVANKTELENLTDKLNKAYTGPTMPALDDCN